MLVLGFLFLSREWESNPRPTRYECVALPAELSRQFKENHFNYSCNGLSKSIIVY